MRRSLRQALVLSVLAVHATFVVCGAGLHALPGLAHAGIFGLGDRPESVDQTGEGGQSTSSDDCPVCHFLAQGQVKTDLADGPSEAVETDRCVIRSTARVLVSKRLLTRLRAPPLFSLSMA